MDQDTTEPAPVRKAADFFHPGSMTEQVETQLGVLTQGVVDCMILATGSFPNLTEGPPTEPNVWHKNKPGSISSWQAARSAELRDAARLSEASARLLMGFARLRGQFSQDFTIRHTDRRGANAKKRLRNTTITHSFSLPGKQAEANDALADVSAEELTRGLAKAAEDMAQRGATPAEDGDPKKKLMEMLDRMAKGGPAADPDDPTPYP